MTAMKAYLKSLFKEGSWEILFSNNYSITISSVVYKVLVSITESQTTSYVKEKVLFGDNQGVFHKGCHCKDHIFSLKASVLLEKARIKKHI